MTAKMSMQIQVHRTETKSESFSERDLRGLHNLLDGEITILTTEEYKELTAKVKRLLVFATNGRVA